PCWPNRRTTPRPRARTPSRTRARGRPESGTARATTVRRARTTGRTRRSQGIRARPGSRSLLPWAERLDRHLLPPHVGPDRLQDRLDLAHVGVDRVHLERQDVLGQLVVDGELVARSVGWG